MLLKPTNLGIKINHQSLVNLYFLFIDYVSIILSDNVLSQKYFLKINHVIMSWGFSTVTEGVALRRIVLCGGCSAVGAHHLL